MSIADVDGFEGCFFGYVGGTGLLDGFPAVTLLVFSNLRLVHLFFC